MQTNDIYNGIKQSPQKIYDSFNNLMFSEDSRVFNKMAKKIEIYNTIKHLLGDIVEFGVFKGAGMAIFLKLVKLYEPNGITKIIGFDFFKPERMLAEISGLNKVMMTDVLGRVDNDELSLTRVKERLDCIQSSNFMLIQGDAVEECKKYYDENPGARIKLLYMDLDLGDPTYKIMKTLWNRIVNEGIIVLDEYGYHKWDESDGVDKFLREIPGQFKLVNTNVLAPTLYIIKTV
jgi:hypothetical protein